MWYVYIIKCKDNSLYTGITTNVNSRLQKHNSGSASKYTRARKPVELLYTEKFISRSKALSREAEIKSLSADKKRELVKYGLGRKFASVVQW